MSSIFSPQRFADIVKETITNIQQLVALKGGEYAGDIDRLANFRKNAERCGVSMPIIWLVYANKHWDAIEQWIKDQSTNTKRQRAEPITSRLDDIIVYALLLKAIVLETEENDSTSV